MVNLINSQFDAFYDKLNDVHMDRDVDDENDDGGRDKPSLKRSNP